MRMWVLNPKLLGEHVEIHMLTGSLVRNKSVQGFLDRGLLEPQNLYARHDELVREMFSRGMNHKSPLPVVLGVLPVGKVDTNISLRDLRARCSRCKERV
jgi:hypothetical protein